MARQKVEQQLPGLLFCFIQCNGLEKMSWALTHFPNQCRVLRAGPLWPDRRAAKCLAFGTLTIRKSKLTGEQGIVNEWDLGSSKLRGSIIKELLVAGFWRCHGMIACQSQAFVPSGNCPWAMQGAHHWLERYSNTPGTPFHLQLGLWKWEPTIGLVRKHCGDWA